MNDSQLAASVLALLDGTADTFLVCAGAGTVVSQKTAAQAKTLLALVKGDVGLGNVDNTSDTAKPVSTAQQTAIDAKVTGPSSATDNAVARFDATTGKLVQNSGVTIDDSNNVSGIGTLDTSLQIRTSTYVRCIAIHDNINQRQMVFGGGFVQIDQPVYLVNTLFFNGAGTTSMSFSSAGVAQIGTTSANANGSLLLTNLTASGLLCCGVYTFATVPSASSNTGKFLRISDRAQKHAYSDGTNWRFFGDDAIIS